MPNYNFSYSTSDLISQLHLQKHPEGGYFAETDRQPLEILSPYANGESRSLATSIFYLLTYEERSGVFHMNKSVTQHVLHEGRAEYTLITPSESGASPKIEKVIMGANAAAGEQRQLIVGSGIWKRSAIPKDDILSAISPQDKDHTGCLITEVVFPGFHWGDHTFLTKRGLEDLLKGTPGGEERIMEYGIHLKE